MSDNLAGSPRPAGGRLSRQEKVFAWLMLGLPLVGCVIGILVGATLEPADGGADDSSIFYLLLTLMAGSFFFLPVYLPVAIAAGVAALFLPRRAAVLVLAGLPVAFGLVITFVGAGGDGAMKMFLMAAGLGLFYVAVAGALYALARRLRWV